MNILGCLDTPTAGAYSFQGVHVEETDAQPARAVRRHFLGFVFQGFNLLPRTTASRTWNSRCSIVAKPIRERRPAAREALRLGSAWRAGRRTRRRNCRAGSSSAWRLPARS